MSGTVTISHSVFWMRHLSFRSKMSRQTLISYS